MKRGGRLPDDQAEVVFADVFVEQVADLTEAEQLDVLRAVQRLIEAPDGKHPLSAPLVGWNTEAVLGGHQRIVYKATAEGGVGLIEVLCLGPRAASEVYDLAVALARILDPHDMTQVWESLALLDIVAEAVGLDGWDYRPPPAPEGLIRASVAAQALDEQTARMLSKHEIEAALAAAWEHGGADADPVAAVRAALRSARGSITPPADRDILDERRAERCSAAMPRAGVACIRKAGHPGAHRAR